jgi:hypothetical protein
MRELALGVFLAAGLSTSASASVFQIDVVGSGNGWEISSFAGLSFDVSDGKTPTAGFLGTGWELSFASSTELANSLPNAPVIPLEDLDLSTGQAFFDPAGLNGRGSFSGCSGLLLPLCFGAPFPFLPQPMFDALLDTFSAEVTVPFGGSLTRANEEGLSWTGVAIDLFGLNATFRVGDILYVPGADGDFSFGATFSSTKVSVVPLPATFAPLLASLVLVGALKAVRRRGKAGTRPHINAVTG